MNKREEPMKWWGWGAEDVAFSDRDKPAMAPFLKRHLDLDPAAPTSRPLPFAALDVPDATLPDGLRVALHDAVGPVHVSTGAHDRVVHARGKSLRHLLRQRAGDLGRLPGVVVRPADE